LAQFSSGVVNAVGRFLPLLINCGLGQSSKAISKLVETLIQWGIFTLVRFRVMPYKVL